MYSNQTRETMYLGLTTEMSNRAIGRHLDLSHNTVGSYRRRAQKLSLDWPAIEKMDDLELELVIVGQRCRSKPKRMPDWGRIHRELQRKGVTLELLWEEYRLADPTDAYSYSQFTHLYREYVEQVDVVMRQVHRAGKCAFVDFSGKKLWYTDVVTGARHEVEIFVGCLGCSKYSFAYGTESQSAIDWISAINYMLAYLGGVPEAIVSDNLKAAVIRAGRDPVFNRTYLELARHFGFAIVSTRVRHPRDNAPAENAVLNAQRRVLAPLRNRTFFSLEEINGAIRELLPLLNERPFAKMPGSRLSWFEALDQPVLKPLPAEPFEYAEWTAAQKVPKDYHIRIRDHYYSVPCALIHSYVEARITATMVEFYQGGKRVSSHILSKVVAGRSTLREHQPPAHQHYAEQTPEKFLEWANGIGTAAVAAVQNQFDGNPHGLLGLRACGNLKRLARDVGAERFEAACKRAQDIGSLTVKSIRSILARGLDARLPQDAPVQVDLPLHSNVRGRDYYSGR